MFWRFPVCLLLAGCGLAHRVRRFPAPARHVFTPPAGALAEVSVQTPDAQRPYQAEAYPQQPALGRPMLISEQHAIVIEPEAPVSVRVLIRPVGVPRGPFFEVAAVTGARDRELVDEVRFLPRTIDAPYRLPITDLTNVYNGYDVDHDDLILVELSQGDQVERYLFSNRTIGPYTDVAFDLLVRTPIQPTTEDSPTLSPALTAGLVLGYRSAERDRSLAMVWDRVALQLSVGIGSAALEAAREEEDLVDTLDRALYAALGGGGIRLFDAIAVQALVNANAITEGDPVWTLGVGVDAAKLGGLTRDAGARLLKPNTLSEPPEL